MPPPASHLYRPARNLEGESDDGATRTTECDRKLPDGNLQAAFQGHSKRLTLVLIRVRNHQVSGASWTIGRIIRQVQLVETRSYLDCDFQSGGKVRQTRIWLTRLQRDWAFMALGSLWKSSGGFFAN